MNTLVGFYLGLFHYTLRGDSMKYRIMLDNVKNQYYVEVYFPAANAWHQLTKEELSPAYMPVPGQTSGPMYIPTLLYGNSENEAEEWIQQYHKLHNGPTIIREMEL
jgi:hypothetical protein